MRSGTALIALVAVLSPVTALLVAPGSPCSSYCGNVLSSTSASEISCSKSQYTSTSAGTIFEGCINCELASTYVTGGQTDTQWMLYNLRYALSYCVFDDPEHADYSDNPCMTRTACGPLMDAIQYANLTTNGTSYGYCSQWDEAHVANCIGCVKGSDTFFALKNFVTILDAACIQMPLPGTPVSVAGNPFSDVQVNITVPTPTAKVSYTSSSLSLGAKVGIAIGGIALILSTIGACIVWNGKRRRRAFLRRLETQHGQGVWSSPQAGDMFETPVSQKPLTGWQDSPLSAHSEKTFPRYFSPYSSQYNSPTSAVEGPGKFQWPDQAQAREIAIGIALGGKDDYSPSSDVKGKGKQMEEAYEMSEVDSQGNQYMPKAPDAPVLHHPGYGRGNPNRLYPNMEGDAMGRGALV